MSKYTMEVRYVCEIEAGLKKSVGLKDVKNVVSAACPKIFDDDIPFFDEAYRLPLEKKILMHYYTREIGAETVALWKLWLNNRMRELMPYYNQLYESTLIEFNPLYTKDYTEEYDKTGNKVGNRTANREASMSGTENGDTSAHGESTDNATSRRLYSDTPQGGLNGIESNTYLTNATKNIGDTHTVTDNTLDSENTKTQNTTEDNTEDTNEDTTENFVRRVAGFDGGSSSKRIKEFRETFLNIDLQIIEELGDLFINLW